MEKPLRIGVLGAGHLGRIHVQQLRELPQFELVGVYDPHAEKSARLHEEFQVPVLGGIAELIAAVDAVDVVTPTLAHHACAMQALDAGKHVFIEKPIAHTLDEARQMVAREAETGLKVQVGHVERFNPAFLAARAALRTPMFIETHRLAQFDPRGTDVSVVLDLMIHDLDIILHVVGAEVADVHASGVAVVSDTPDIANARIAFANGCVANLTASRISMKKMRKSRFFQKDAYIAVDMLKKETEIMRMRTVESADPFAVTLDLGPGKGLREIDFEKPEIPATNAIREELRAFGTAITEGRTPEVPATDGLAALALAHRVLEAMDVRKG
ncbi:MAG: Gfo/Idh/MocA family oxidoreductase [Flavobacteriales bacterium]|nr:Gfo/Idh/MocA family oxidoreductase [Flavobacteriales bacterium]MCL4282262.1 Gfo/Idh/MocA family oxidoreductase [Flavobacteriales bacterium]